MADWIRAWKGDITKLEKAVYSQPEIVFLSIINSPTLKVRTYLVTFLVHYQVFSLWINFTQNTHNQSCKDYCKKQTQDSMNYLKVTETMRSNQEYSNLRLDNSNTFSIWV